MPRPWHHTHPNAQAKDAGLLDKDAGGVSKRRKTADGGGVATGGGEGGEGEGEKEDEDEEDEEAFLRRALESDEIDEETIKVGKKGGKEGRRERWRLLGFWRPYSSLSSLSLLLLLPQKILEAADKQQDVVELDLPGVKKLFLGLERKIQVRRIRRRRGGGR